MRLQVWLGYQQSLRACQMGLSLNVDTASTVFLAPQPMAQYICGFLGLRGPELLTNLTNELFRKANNACKNIKVGQFCFEAGHSLAESAAALPLH